MTGISTFLKKILFLIALLLFIVPVAFAQSPSPIPTPVHPTDLGFTPLRYHCRQETSPEFHPLRPYPASPCDPLIPRRDPWATDNTIDPESDQYRLYLSPYCGKSLNVRGTVTVSDVVDATGGQIDQFPANWQTANLDELYFCTGSTTDICFLRRITFAVTWDFQNSQFPILGNTQDFLQDPQKVNQYLDWYLNGTVQQSEQIPLDMTTEEDNQRLTTFGGPVKKLLPFESQLNLKDILVNENVGTQYHDYDIEDPQWPNTPFSSQEDITAEATVGIYTEGQPVSPEIDGQIVSIGLSIGSADSRLYFPHLRSSNALSDILAGLTRPLPNNVDSTDEQQVSQQITQHQGENPPVPGGADTTQVQIDYEYPIEPGQVSRNTEVREFNPAPAPILAYSDLPGSTGQRCDLPGPIKPGDDLVGSQINGTLAYIQLFRYTPQIIVADSCAGMGSNCRDNCLLENDNCSSTGTPCCWGTCPPADPLAGCRGFDTDGNDCSYIGSELNCTNTPGCTWINSGTCLGPPELGCSSAATAVDCLARSPSCSWQTAYETVYCPAWPTIELDTAARAATFTKTPLVDKIYDTLVVGTQSVLRRFLPLAATTSGEYLEGETDLDNAREVGTVADYTGSSSDVNNPTVDAGLSGGGTIYFPRLESLFRHFLGGSINVRNNLQCLLRPFGQCASPNLVCADVINALPENSGACGICNADSILGPLAQRILAAAGTAFNVPAANIWTAMWHEGATWSEFNGQFTDENVMLWSLPEWCGGQPMPSCDNENPNTQPPFGWISLWFYNGDADVGYWSAVQEVDPTRNTKDLVSRCNFMDAAFATAKSLQAGSAMWADSSCNPPFSFTNTRPASCASWTADKVAQSQRAYGGCALNADGTCARCQYENVPYTLSDLVSIFDTYRCY